jgi:5,10-methylene-tetrahydrofolate dehydrogenase/methenyl tetrahydrofolate cyclohydrolase
MNAVVIGRSNIVGIPMALLLMNASATVTICHSRTKNVAEKVKEADIVVAACGQPEYVKGDWIKEGAIVIDVGINNIPDASRKSGQRLVGDVEFKTVMVYNVFVGKGESRTYYSSSRWCWTNDYCYAPKQRSEIMEEG